MQKNKPTSLTSVFFIFADLFLLTISLYILLYVRYQYELNLENTKILIRAHYKANLLMIIFWLFSANYLKLYHTNRFNRFIVVIRKVFFHVFIFSIILFAISGLKKEDLFSLELSINFLLIIFVYLLGSRIIVHFIIKFYRKKGFNLKKIIIIGYNDNASNLIDLLKTRKDLGLELKNVFVTKDPVENQMLLQSSTFETYLSQNKIDFAYICMGNGIDEQQINHITEILEKRYVATGFIPSTSLEVQQSLDINYLDSFPILTYKKYPLDNSLNQIIKRIFDIVFSLIIFVLILWWALPLLALMVFITQGSPILFKQKRNGLNGREFDCLKFRTMRPDKDNNKKPTERDDPRITKLGKILRKSSLDELPQFINVLKGDMSIVGPRPHMVSENESYSEIIKRYALRHYVKPGITGLAQVKGYRGAVDTDKDMEMRIRTDIYYVRNWSFLLDLLIIYKTGKLMIFGDENAI